MPGGKPADTEDFCSVLGVLASGAQVTLQVSRAARGRGEHSIEAYGSAGALEYRLDRSAPRWYRGELRAAGTSGGLAPVATPAGLPRSAGEGDPSNVIGKTTIAPLVKRFLAAIRKGEPASPTLEDGLRAQAVLDAVLEAETGGRLGRREGPAARREGGGRGRCGRRRRCGAGHPARQGVDMAARCAY